MTYSPIAVPLPLSDRFSVRCQGTEYPVYQGMDFDFVHLTTLDILSVEVTVSMPIDEVALRPLPQTKGVYRAGQHRCAVPCPRRLFLP